MIYTLENEQVKVQVSSTGAELFSILHKGTGKEYLWQGHPDIWPRRAPVLFPFVGRLKENKYQYIGIDYSMPQHGFARDREFKLHKNEVDQIIFELSSDTKSRKNFPFDFNLRIQYQLVQNKIEITYLVENPGTENLYFSIGGHPGFNCPLNTKESFSDYYLEFENAEAFQRHLLSDGLFTGETEPLQTNGTILNLSYDLFRKDAIVLKEIQSEVIWLKSRKSDYSLKFSFAGFPQFGIWTKQSAPFICLEPWCGYADPIDAYGDLIKKPGINSIIPGEKFSRSYSVEIEVPLTL